MGGNPQIALDRLKGPAIGLLVCSGIAICFLIYGIISNLLNPLAVEEAMAQMKDAMEQSGVDFDPELIAGLMRYQLVLNFLNLVVHTLIIVGAAAMLRAKNYGLAMTACVLSVIPCFGCNCCFINVGIAIWGLITLFDEDVKRVFN